MAKKPANSEIAKIALSLGWCAGVSELVIQEVSRRYQLSERAAFNAWVRLMKSGLVRVELEERPEMGELTKTRFVLCDGVTEEML